MAKKKKQRPTAKEAASDLETILGENPSEREHAAELFGDVTRGIENFVDFQRGVGDAMRWIEANRIIGGKPFSFESADVAMMLGEGEEKPPSFPRPYLRQVYNDKAPDKTIIKSRQCLREDSVVFKVTDDGRKEPATAEELHAERYRGKVLTHDGSAECAVAVTDCWRSGRKKMLEVGVKAGYTLNCSRKEKVWVEGIGFRLAKDLVKGDALRLIEQRESGFGVMSVDKAFAKSLGMFFGDGSSVRRVFFSSKSAEYARTFESGCGGSTTRRRGNGQYDVFPGNDSAMMSWITRHGLRGKLKADRIIASEIFSEWDRDSTAAFIGGLYAADGWLSKVRGKHGEMKFEIGIGLQNVRTLHQLQVLLRRFDISSRLRETNPGSKGKTRFYKLKVMRFDDIFSFAKNFPVQDKIDARDIEEMEREHMDRLLYPHRKCHHVSMGDNQVTYVRELEDAMTYDLSVADKERHRFFANGILVSNSELSETEINENLYLACSRPYTNVRHIFPTAGMANKIGKEKIGPAAERSPRIAEQLKKPYNVTAKEFANGSWYTVEGSWADWQGRGPSSDKITFDEYESMNPAIEDIFSESTSHSALSKKTRISTPMFPNGGIDEKFQRGAMWEWHVTCAKCGKEQTMEFPDNLIGFFEASREERDSETYVKRLGKAYVGCRHCGAPVDRSSQHYLKNSRWVAAKPHLALTRSSYRVTYMMMPWKTGREILSKYHSFRYLHQFWNEVMGHAYLSAEAKVSREIFESCCDPSFSNLFQKVGMARNVSVGVDWGGGEVGSWVVVRGGGFPPDTKKPRVLYVERITTESLKRQGFAGTGPDHATRVMEICEFFNFKILVNDANGIGADRNTTLIKAYPSKAWGCFYDTDETDKQRHKRHKEMLIVPSWGEGSRRVTCSRLTTLKDLIQEYSERKVSIPRLDPEIEAFVKHHAAAAIERYQDEATDSYYEVVGHTGPDHYFHSDNYARIGYERIAGTGQGSATGGVIMGGDGYGKGKGGYDPLADDNVHPLLR